MTNKVTNQQNINLRIHLSRMIFSQIGYNGCRHYWTFLLNCQKNGCNDASNCIKAESAISIDTMALSMKDFIDSSSQKPRF